MDFFQISTREIEKGPKKGQFEVYPDFIVGKTKDLMVRGRAFRAIYDEQEGLWSTDEYDVQRLVDHEVLEYAKTHDIRGNVKLMRSFGTNLQTQFRKYVSQISDNSHELDENLTFANTEIKKTDYVSRRLPYSLAPGDISAWDELVGTLYSPEERAKIEWAIGSVVAGDSKKIQKFVVFYGSAGTGKSTILNIIQKLFAGYTTTFEAKALGSNNNAFATEVFRGNPLVAIQHDGDLSKIDDNTKLNSIISHEEMTMNEKYKPSYDARIRAFLFMGTNQPVKISDAKSGIIRRLIDVQPTGVRLSPNHYHTLMARIDFELGAIAHHCLERYREMGKNYYNAYQPLEMMFQTDIFFNYIEWNYDLFKEQDGVSLRQAYALYKEFCDATGIEKGRLPQYKFREELRNYFNEFHDRISLGGETIRSYYQGFKSHQFKAPVNEDPKTWALTLTETVSLFDLEFAETPAQLAKDDGTPRQRWSEVKTTLAEIDTSEIHYVKIGGKQIVMDFDLKGDDGQKSLERNLARAAEFPPTYAELSKSGRGVHLHYRYDGEPEDLARELEPGIEIKVFTGGSSLRRRLSYCNNVPIATISDGLPLKEKKLLSATTIQSDRGLRELIGRNLRKEIHPGTKPSIDFIHKILQDAYEGNFEYDVTDLRPRIIAFANNSTNQSLACLEKVLTMKWKSDDSTPPFEQPYQVVEPPKDDRLVFFDVEVYPNLFVVCWNYDGSDQVVRMINPSSREIEALLKLKLVGFNNRRYDNHILYAAMLGYDNEALYKLSQKIISGSVGAMFAEAYKISWTDVYDFSSVKMGLKKFEILLGLKHKELDFDWDQPVPEEFWEKVVEYCVNDVLATKAVFHSRKQDWIARLILAELAGMTPNDTTQKLTARIVFNGDHNPQKSFVYTDLSKEFPGYVFEKGKSTYRGEIVGEGGYVYAEPGMYEDVALLDVASMHPTSIIQLNAFGEYTPRFAEIVEARLAIKAEDYEKASTLLGGRLAKYLTDPEDSKGLANALKIAINIVYGLTSAKFDNPFRDIRNVDNIVAKRGALFMIDLKHFVQGRGFRVVHIKTDSIKIPGATDEIIEEVKQFGEKYGYTFEYNPKTDRYQKFALVNDAVYVAKSVVPATLEGNNTDAWTSKWTAVGAQFQHPYVFKCLFDTLNPITFDDLCETKQVTKGGLYLDFEGSKPMALSQIPAEMKFIGRTGRFTPVKEDWGGGILYRVQDGKAYAAAGTKGHFWVESEVAKDIYERAAIDMSYFEKLVDDARKTLEKFGNVEEFIG
jgi:hypothetical protein